MTTIFANRSLMAWILGCGSLLIMGVAILMLDFLPPFLNQNPCINTVTLNIAAHLLSILSGISLVYAAWMDRDESTPLRLIVGVIIFFGSILVLITAVDLDPTFWFWASCIVPLLVSAYLPRKRPMMVGGRRPIR
jgi:uncharacterized membrane protein YidH (DUF202 family)